MAGQHDDRRLEAVLAQNADRFAAVDVGETDIHDHEVDLAGLGGLHALRAVLDGDGLKFLVQRQLLGQRIAQLGIVIDDQNFTRIRHQSGIPVAGRRRLDDAALAVLRLCDFAAPPGAK